MKKLFFFSFTCLLANFSFAQSSVDNKSRTEAMQDPKFIEFKNRHDALVKNNQGSTAYSAYFGYDEKLKTVFIDGIIPSATPKSDSFTSKKDYLVVLNDWISKNKHLLKPENQNSLISE